MNRPFTPHHLWGERLERDLAELETRYTRHCDEFSTDWLDYGELDPLEIHEVFLFPDAVTRVVPEVRQVAGGWELVVQGRVVASHEKSWQAVLDWNCSGRTLYPPWRDLPFFFLDKLSARDAKFKLGKMRAHLEMRSRLYKMRRMSGQPVGSRFLSRLKAYRQWCELSQVVLKEQEPEAFRRSAISRGGGKPSGS